MEKSTKQLEEIVDLHQDTLENLLRATWEQQKCIERQHADMTRVKKLYKKQRHVSVMNTLVTISAVAYIVVTTQIILHQEQRINHMDNMISIIRRNRKPEEK